jgi:hypothetical protein
MDDQQAKALKSAVLRACHSPMNYEERTAAYELAQELAALNFDRTVALLKALHPRPRRSPRTLDQIAAHRVEVDARSAAREAKKAAVVKAVTALMAQGIRREPDEFGRRGWPHNFRKVVLNRMVDDKFDVSGVSPTWLRHMLRVYDFDAD